MKKTLCIATLLGVVTFSIEGDYQIISKHLPQPMAHQLAAIFPLFTRILGS